ncbi:MAG TPA: DMT family transporter [Pseudonocardiaceae bacterium]|nr:DMT family transporter [Pseudonocardiaceae bacterium]
MLLSVGLAVLAAAANATASVLQRKGAQRQPRSVGMSPKMILGLIREPVWFGGVAAILAGFLLQAGALATGPIVLVQPILIVELPLTLLLASVVFHNRLRGREWLAITGMSAGVAVLQVGLSPSDGSAHRAPMITWILGCAVSVGVVLALATIGGRHRRAGRAAYLGVATGVAFGFTAALVAGVTSAYGAGGFAAVFTTWQTYVILVAGPSGFFLLQSALRAGRLVASQPGLTLTNPLVAIGWGVAVFGEHVRVSGWIAADVFGAALVVGATILLAGSPLLDGA